MELLPDTAGLLSESRLLVDNERQEGRNAAETAGETNDLFGTGKTSTGIHAQKAGAVRQNAPNPRMQWSWPPLRVAKRVMLTLGANFYRSQEGCLKWQRLFYSIMHRD